MTILTCTDIITDICSNPVADGVSFEVDPEKIYPKEDMEKNKERLQHYCSKILRRIYDTVDETPMYAAVYEG